MKRLMVVLSSAIVVGLMLVPSGVCAGPLSMVVEDTEGDLGFGVDMDTSSISKLWPENVPVAEAAYLDIVCTSLWQKKDSYRFGMELAAALPQQGTALPTGVKLVEWAMWIDPSPFHARDNPVAPLFLIALRYDGSSYSAFILDYATLLTSPVAYSIDGSEFELQFTAASIGNIEFEWWSPMVRAWWGTLGSSGYWFVDAIDFGTATGQVYYDLPWPPE